MTKQEKIKEKLKYQLFIGKISEIIGMEKTVELLQETGRIIDELSNKIDKT